MDYTYTYDRFYIIESQKLAGKLLANTYLSTKWDVIWFELNQENEFTNKCQELNINIDEI